MHPVHTFIWRFHPFGFGVCNVENFWFFGDRSSLTGYCNFSWNIVNRLLQLFLEHRYIRRSHRIKNYRSRVPELPPHLHTAFHKYSTWLDDNPFILHESEEPLVRSLITLTHRTSKKEFILYLQTWRTGNNLTPAMHTWPSRRWIKGP